MGVISVVYLITFLSFYILKGFYLVKTKNILENTKHVL